MQPGNRRAIVAALIANAGIAVAKLVGFTVTGAASLLAEGVHSIADSTNQALLLWGASAAQRAPSPSHPFGYGRERYFWSFVVALVIFTLGSLFAIYEGIGKLFHPHELANIGWAVGILVLGIVLESYSFRTAIREARPLRGSASWWEFIRDTKNPELPVVLLEDFGALLGLAMALIGIGLAALTGDSRFDALGSVAIGVLLGVIAVVLAIEMKSLLIGEAAGPEDEEAIQEVLAASEGVDRIIHMRTLHLGPDHVLVAAKVEFGTDISAAAIPAAIDVAEERIRQRVPAARTIFIEPDVYRGPGGAS